MAINMFDAKTTQRLSVALLAAAGALTFNAFQLIAAGLGTNDKVYAAGVSNALAPLEWSLGFGVAAFILAQIAGDERVPKEGRFWSTRNLLQTAFVYICVAGLGGLVIGAYMLFSAARVTAN